jgi:cytochrome c
MKTRPSFAFRRGAAVLAAVMSITGLVAAPHAVQADKPARFSVLVFARSAGFAHPSIPSAVTAIEGLGQKKGFDVVATTDPDMFNTTELAKYDAVVFVNTTGDVLPLASQRSALESYIRAGGGWVGAHAASDVGGAVRNSWPWFVGLVGAAFQGHTRTHVWAAGPVPGTIYEGPLSEAPADAESFGTTLRYRSWEPALVDVEDVNSPATRGWGQRRTMVDEWYGFLTNPRGTVHVLASLDETSYDTFQGDMGAGAADHPIVWCQNYDGGRSVYTGLGHTAAAWSDKKFLAQIEGAIEMAAGVAPFDCAP